VPCTSPFLAGPLTQDTHQFEVQAVNQFTYLDGTQVVDMTPATYEWTIQDTVPPDTTIVSAIILGPTDLVEPNSLRFEFTGADNGTAPFELEFECSLDGGPFEGCSTPHYIALDELTGGAHELQVRAVDELGNVDPTPASYAWTTEAEPNTAILSGPDAQTESTEATFVFSSDQFGATFECALDGATAFTACPSPVTFTNVPYGAHELLVRARSPMGTAVDLTPAEYAWESGDMTPPVVTITSGPAASTTDTTATFTFTSDDPAALFQCSLDGSPLVFCTSPVTYTNLLAGTHTFEVEATKPNLLVEGVAAVWEWTVVDNVAPETTIVSGPAAEIGVGTSATFAFSSNEAGATFECALDGGPFAPCASPVEQSDLLLGEHTFQVRATDAAGNVDPTPASWTWTVVNTPAGTNVTVELTTTVGTTATVTFAEVSAFGETTLAASDNPPTLSDGYLQLGATFYDLNTTASFTGTVTVCFSYDPASFTDPDAVRLLHYDGSTWVDVTTSNDPVAGQVCGEVTSLSPFGIAMRDTTPPETTFDSGPASSTSTSATITFSSDEPGSTFECSLDGAAFAACVSPVELSGLAVGTHTFQVRATDRAGNTDPTPASHTWTVEDGVPPETTIDSGPAATTTSTDATFAFSADEPGSTFECALDGAAFAACTSPVELSGLAVGAHTFAVRATDPAGNVDPTPASYAWTVEAPVDCGGPVTVSASADAWIDQNSSSNNFGSDSILKVQSKSGNNFRALVRFTLPAAPAGCVVQSAKLRLYAASYKSGRTLQALRINAAWTEGGVTWSNQPATTGTAATTSSGSGYREWDVASQVQAMYDTGANYGFLIRDASEGADAEQQFHSREKGESVPQLVITFAPAGG
jgi:hypothetical protein